MPRAGEGASEASLWTLFTALLGLLFGRWSTARARAEQAEALAAALERVARLEAELAQARDEAAQRTDAALPPAPSKTIVRVKLHGQRARRRRRL